MPKLVVPPGPIDGVSVGALNTIKELIKSGRQVFGSPGASLTWGIEGSDEGDVSAGLEGEKMTSKLLRAWAQEKCPTAIVVHSAGWPGSQGDTDHMLIVGNHVLLIDSKRWKTKRKYSFSDKGTIKRGTVEFPEGNVKMMPALSAWRRVLGGKVKVSGIVCIAQDEVFVPYDKNWHKSPFKLVTAESLPSYLDEFVSKLDADERNTVNLGLVSSIIVRAIKPRDRRRELINVKGMN